MNFFCSPTLQKVWCASVCICNPVGHCKMDAMFHLPECIQHRADSEFSFYKIPTCIYLLYATMNGFATTFISDKLNFGFAGLLFVDSSILCKQFLEMQIIYFLYFFMFVTGSTEVFASILQNIYSLQFVLSYLLVFSNGSVLEFGE